MATRASVAHPAESRAERYTPNAPSHEGGQPTYIVQSGSAGSGSFKTYVVWGLVGTVAAATLVYLGYKGYRKVVSNQAAKDSLDTGTPAYFAQQIKMGIENDNAFGTNTKQIRQAFVDIPDKATFRKTAENYHKQYGGTLFGDLHEHLKSTEMQEMIAIYSVKPEKAGKNAQPIYDPYAWADRVNAAVNFSTWGWFWGTDLDAFKQVIAEIPDQKAWDDTKDAYQSKYHVSMIDDIDGDVSSWDYDFRKELSKKGITAGDS